MGEHEEGETSFDEIVAPVNHPKRLAAIGAMGLAAAASFFGLWHRVGLPFDIIGLVATLVGGWPIWMEAWEAIREKQINMEITMALGVVAALVIGQFGTAAVIVAFTLFSMYLEDLTKSRGKRALAVLLRAAPDSAQAKRGDTWTTVKPEALAVGDIVLVRPGEKIPADGVVRAGDSTVVEAAITGEPFPQAKRPGSTAYAGTINGNGALEIEVTHRAEDTAYARIVQLVREAGERRGKTQRLADRVAQGIVYVVLTAAALTFLFTRSLTSTISVVLVAGACGVAAGTPLAILATTARSAGRGVIVKGGEGVEALAQADTVVFDKTGTLTKGTPTLARVATFNGATREALLRTLAAVEQGSDHPVAQAILATAAPTRIAQNVEYVGGRGVRGIVEGQEIVIGNLAFLTERGVRVEPDAERERDDAKQRGHILVFAAVGGKLQGALHLADEVRAEAPRAISDLRAMGLRVIMLTGDHEGAARETARQLGIDDLRADLLPEDKIRIVQEMKAAGARVCFVGDGINDAPALTEAHVGVAMGSGSEAALETADVILMTSDLGKLVDTLRSARRSQRVILFNFGGTMIVDLAGIALASAGLLGPLVAALVHVGSELVFIANSARLFAVKE